MSKVNLSLNGIPGTIWEIRRQEYTHWYLGYRQAILITNSLTKTLKNATLAHKNALLELKAKQQALLGKIGDEFDIFALEIEILEDSLEEHKQLIRDSQIEYEVALKEKIRIETEHPEIGSCDYHQLQERYATEAFRNKLARHVAIAAYSVHKGLPEGTSEVIHDMLAFSVSEQQEFSAKITAKMFELMIPPISNNIDTNHIQGGDINEFILRGN